MHSNEVRDWPNRLKTTYMVLEGRHCESCLKVVINYKNNSLLLCDGAKPTLKFLAPSELKLRLAELYPEISVLLTRQDNLPAEAQSASTSYGG
jgi:hypothetical protein